MERSFRKEVQALKLGDGETFRGEGILAVTKALLQSGVSYVGGYQGAPVSHLLDVLVRRRSSATSACSWKPAPTGHPRRPCSVPRSTIRCAGR
jgi:TPP-dependent indolepyruvate ferredoxin oxidoreductase alpha subunit